MEFQEFVLRLGAAVLAGFMIGIEREMMNKSAGLRTSIMVTIGAAIYVLISYKFISGEPSSSARIIGQIITGVGFLGAGVIIRRETQVKGLTTAATIWTSAAVGCLAAIGMYKELLVCTFLIIFINRGVIFITRMLNSNKFENDEEGKNRK